MLALLVWCVPHLSTVNMTFRGISPVGTTTYMTSLRLIHFQILYVCMYVCMYVCRRVTFWTLLQLERLLVDVLALVGHDYEGPRLTVLRQHGGVCMYVRMYVYVSVPTNLSGAPRDGHPSEGALAGQPLGSSAFIALHSHHSGLGPAVATHTYIQTDRHTAHKLHTFLCCTL